MKIIELTNDQDSIYKDFFDQGLMEYPDKFRITTRDYENEYILTNGSSDSYTLGATDENGEIIGVVSFERDGKTRERLRHKGILFRMYVSSQYAGRSIGYKLIEEVIGRAKLLENMEQINLTVLSHNERAKRLYRKFGFESFCVEKNGVKDGKNYYHEEQMVLFL